MAVMRALAPTTFATFAFLALTPGQAMAADNSESFVVLGGGALDVQLHALLIRPATPTVVPAGRVPDPLVAAAWSAVPALMIFTTYLGSNAYEESRLNNGGPTGVPFSQFQAKARALAFYYRPTTAITAYTQLGAVFTSFTFGAGQVYSGDILRGIGVTLGGPPVTLLGFFAGGLLGNILSEFTDPGNQDFGRQMDSFREGAFPGAVTACALYGAWATWDAYQLALAKQQAATVVPFAAAP